MEKAKSGPTWQTVAILVVIIAILASLALPSYQDYMSKGSVSHGHIVTTSRESPVDQLLRSMPFGEIAFTTPRVMNIEDTKEVRLILSPLLDAVDLEERLKSEDPVQAARVRISNRMHAHLTGGGFDITPVTPEVQAVAGTETTEWKWTVVPRSAGNQMLNLALSAHLQVDGAETMRTVRTFEAVIPVQVRWYQTAGAFVSDNWQWLWTVILIPLVTMWWKRKKRPRADD